MLVPDQQIQQQPHRHMQVVHHRQRAALHQTGAFVPPVHAQRRADQPKEHQHAPLQRCIGQVVGLAEHQERRQHHQQRTHVEEAKTPVMRQVAWVAFHQVLVHHLPSGVGEVGQLQQQEATEEVRGDLVETNHRRPGHGHQCRHQCPRVEAPIKGVFDQGHMQWREDGEQQHLRHRQHAKAQVQANVGHTELQRADHQHAAHERRFHRAPAGQWDKYQPGQQYAHQHREVTVDVTGEVFADQAEGKCLNQGDNQ